MRKRILLPLLLLLFSSSAQAQATPEQTARSFYQWYLTEMNAERHPIRDNKKEMLSRVSNRLGRWLYSSAYQEYGADYIIDAQDWDQNWAKNVTAKRASLKGKTAVVKVTLSIPRGTYSGFGTRVMTVRLVNEAGAWKIDSINNRALVR